MYRSRGRSPERQAERREEARQEIEEADQRKEEDKLKGGKEEGSEEEKVIQKQENHTGSIETYYLLYRISSSSEFPIDYFGGSKRWSSHDLPMKWVKSNWRKNKIIGYLGLSSRYGISLDPSIVETVKKADHLAGNKIKRRCHGKKTIGENNQDSFMNLILYIHRLPSNLYLPPGIHLQRDMAPLNEQAVPTGHHSLGATNGELQPTEFVERLKQIQWCKPWILKLTYNAMPDNGDVVMREIEQNAVEDLGIQAGKTVLRLSEMLLQPEDDQ